MIVVEKDMVDCMAISTVRACDVVISVGPEAGRVVGIKGVAGDELEGGQLVCAGMCRKNSDDERVEG